MFHRIDCIESLTAERFFRFADRLIAYSGVVRHRAELEQEEEQSARERRSKSSSGDSDETRHFRDVNHNPELSQYFG